MLLHEVLLGASRPGDQLGLALIQHRKVWFLIVELNFLAALDEMDSFYWLIWILFSEDRGLRQWRVDLELRDLAVVLQQFH